MFLVFSRSQVSPLRRTAVAPCRPTIDRATESRELLTVISPLKKNSFQISSLRFYAQAVSCHGLSHHVLQKGRPHSKAPTPPFYPRRLDSLDATHHDIGATSRTVMSVAWPANKHGYFDLVQPAYWSLTIHVHPSFARFVSAVIHYQTPPRTPHA